MKTQYKYPTGKSNEFASEDILKGLATYEEAKEANEKGINIYESLHYWFDFTSFNREYPIGLMDKEDAEFVVKGCCFLDFASTIPAITKEQYETFINKTP